ncbi:MAG: phosphotransferase family protein [Anaerolineae bacterium]
MRELLQAYYRENIQGRQDAVVTHMEELHAGWENIVHFVDISFGTPGGMCEEQRVLRIYPWDVGAYKARSEFRTLQRLYALGYPVPQVYTLATDDSPLGAPFMLMERAPGIMMWNSIFRDPSPERQERLLRLFCQRLVDLHRLDWRAFAGEDAAATEEPRDLLNVALEQLRWLAGPLQHGGYRAAFAWLETQLATVPAHQPAVVHMDFHPANVLLAPDDGTIVLDWTQAGISDPRVDLAWTLLLIGAAEGWDWRDRVLAQYERLSGEHWHEITVFEAHACVRRLLVVNVVMQGDGGRLGLRADLQSTLMRQLDSLRRVYYRLTALTGLTIPDMEALFAESPAGPQPDPAEA